MPSSDTHRPSAMGNYFLLNHTDRWAAVCIAKNGCSTLKASVLFQEGIPFQDIIQTHSIIGYTGQSRFLIPVEDSPPDDYQSFAIWRDPVARLISVYQQFILDAVPHRRYEDKLDYTFDMFLDFTSEEHQKQSEHQDEHLRAQSSFYKRHQVDAIIDISFLDGWFKKNNWHLSGHLNPSQAKYSPSPRQVRRIQRLYAQDYELKGSPA